MRSRPDAAFMARSRALEAAYLASDDPVEQSGFHGGRDRWIRERSPLIEAIDGDGDFLDVGCANGLLAADVVAWAAERGHRVTPHGVDIGPRLIALARRRLPDYADNFVLADAWSWQPDDQWTYVYSMLDLSPTDLRCTWLARLHALVARDGKLIVGAYGSLSRCIEPEHPVEALEACGYRVAGCSAGGDVVNSRFAWVLAEA